MTAPLPMDRDAVLDQLAKVLASSEFRRAARSSALLRFIVERTLAGEADRLKEYTLGAEALERGAAFDPRIDPTVRAEASRLRDRLVRYYADEGADDSYLFELPRGSYVPRIVARVAGATARPLAEPDAHRPKPSEVATPVSRGSSTAAPGRTASPVRLVGAAALVTFVFVGAWAVRRSVDVRSGPADRAPSRPLQQYDADLRVDATLGSEVGPDLVLTADGGRVVFVARDSAGVNWLYVRRLDRSTAERLPGTAGARVPFLSPDGRWVGFWSAGQVKRTAIDGGSPVVLCEATDLLGASWGRDGRIIVAINPTNRLWSIPETGGELRPVVDLSGERVMPLWPQSLAGGTAVVYTASGAAGADRANVEVYSFADRARRVLVRGGTFGRVLPGGYLSYVNQGTLYVVPFDTARLVVRGAAVPVLDDVAYSRTFGFAQVDVAPSGTLVYRRAPGRGQLVVDWIDRGGRHAPLLATPGRYDWPSLSRDGRQLAVSVFESGVGEIRVHDLGTGNVRHARTGTADHSGLVFLPDASLLLFGGRDGLMTTNPEAASGGLPRRLTNATRIQVPWSLGAAGGRLAYAQLDDTTGFDLYTASMTRTADGLVLGTPEPYLRTAAFEIYPTFSPDGRWIAYTSNESGPYEVYVRAFPDNGRTVRVSSKGGRVPRWSPNGRELLFQTDGQQVFVAPYRVVNGVFTAGTPRLWTNDPLGDTGVYPGFDVSPDGERIAALLPAGNPADRQARNHVTFLLHFLDDLQRRRGGS